MKEEIRLGMKVRDNVTGVRGVVTGIANYIDGYETALVEYRNTTSTKIEDWIATNRLMALSEEGRHV